MLLRHRALISCAAFCGLAVAGRAAFLPSGAELLPLKNGVTNVALGDNRLMVMLAHRENFNAHSYETASFYIQTTAAESDPQQWQIIAIETKRENERWMNAIDVSGGADCQLHTFRLLIDSASKSVYLLCADRAPGKSYADEEAVTFTIYELRFNANGDIGPSVAFFRQLRSDKAKKKYCDVDEALKAELDLAGAIAPKQ
ncbi:MAG: hypothetical protein ACJ8JD_00045 [Chthoniobacterales bacterium]|jgi:hypothetical protein